MRVVTHQDPYAPVRRRVAPPQAPQDADAALPGTPGPGNGQQAQGTDPGLGLTEAAAALGISKRDLQGRCRGGADFCTKAENGRWLVDVDAARSVLAAEG